ncbi:MAG: hypothetical protein ACYSOL_07145 [Planctomycetota bacterium]
MFVSGLSPKRKAIHIPRGRGEKRLQMALLQYYDRRNYKVINEYLSPRNKRKLLAQIRNLQTDGPVQKTKARRCKQARKQEPEAQTLNWLRCLLHKSSEMLWHALSAPVGHCVCGFLRSLRQTQDRWDLQDLWTIIC